MFDFKRALKSATMPEGTEFIELSTPWGDELEAGRVLTEHPRPTLERAAYTMLNGVWEYAIVALQDPDGAPGAAAGPPGAAAGPSAAAPSRTAALAALKAAKPPTGFDGKILVPFSPEAPVSGVGRAVLPSELIWYRRRFEVPALAAGERLILHFEAVDWACAVYLDGRLAAEHTGGYLPFDVDATPFLGACARPQSAVLSVCAYDPNSAGTQPRGKQSLNPGGIWYTAQSGIWQSVWYEVVPAAHVTSLALKGDGLGSLSFEVGYTAPAGAVLGINVCDANGMARARRLLTVDASDDGTVRGKLPVGNPHLWSPEEPYLYGVQITLRATGPEGDAVDRVKSYCAFRTVEVARDADGTARFMLNGRPYFLRGALDQGYWPDGLLTAPSDEALAHDIAAAKELGFNLLRKHVKIESARWYYHADRLGMLVWQDVPCGGGPYSLWWTSRLPTVVSAAQTMIGDGGDAARRRLSSDDEAYRREWTDTCTEMVQALGQHPCIACWSLFNEGWGQFDAAAAAEHVHNLDPSRPIDATSGWYDQRCGDFLSVHNYFRPLEAPKDAGTLQGYAADRGARAAVLSEFGGLTQAEPGHAATPEAYGYGDFDTPEAWRAAVRELLDQAGALEAQGLSGYVYTQLTDVEGELNGLLTYDRRVNKLEG